MNLFPLTDRDKIRAAFVTLNQTLNRECQQLRRLIGGQGGSGEFDVYWEPNENFWTAIPSETSLSDGRHILLLGVLDQLGVRVLEFGWKKNRPVFSNLSDVLKPS